MFKKLFALAIAVVAMGTIGVATAFAAPVLTDTVSITNNIDNGHNGGWAFENFQRTITITKSDVPGTYNVTLNDNGVFQTIAGAKSPRQGVVLSKVDGTFTGEYHLTVVSATAPSAAHVARSYNYQCDAMENCPGRPASTSDWPKLYFGDTAVVNGGDYNWTYKTGCETWVDASNNNDGMDANAGDITGKACPTPTPTPTEAPTPSPAPSGGTSGGAPVTTPPAGTTPGLPSTGLAPVAKG